MTLSSFSCALPADVHVSPLTVRTPAGALTMVHYVFLILITLVRTRF
jgi:hypothetical protein